MWLGALVTFKDSQWLLSIVVPHQPHFLDQPEDVQVFWGYALFTDKTGDFVKVRWFLLFSSTPHCSRLRSPETHVRVHGSRDL